MDETPHPGRILLDEVMTPLGVSRNQLARDIDVPVGRISAIVSGARAITADTALRLARYFGTTPELWLRLQADYDLARAREQAGPEIEERVRVLQTRAPIAEAPAAPAHEALTPEAAPEEPPAPPVATPEPEAEEPLALDVPAPELEEPVVPLGAAERAPDATPASGLSLAWSAEEAPPSSPAPPLGPAVGASHGEAQSGEAQNGEANNGHEGMAPGGTLAFWRETAEREEAELRQRGQDDNDDDVLDLSADMMVAEPAGAAADAPNEDASRETVPPIPDPPRQR